MGTCNSCLHLGFDLTVNSNLSFHFYYTISMLATAESVIISLQFNKQALQIQLKHMLTGFDREEVNKFWFKQTNLAVDQAIYST